MWSEIKLDLHRWEKLDLSLIGRISVLKISFTSLGGEF